MFDPLGIVVRDLRMASAFYGAVLAPLGSPYIQIGDAGDENVIHPHQTIVVKLSFESTSSAPITYSTRVLPVTPVP